MKFYHGTSKKSWDKIQKEGMLWGIRPLAKSRCTYLAVDKAEAEQHGEVVLEVVYEPDPTNDNYFPECWQLRVYTPILINKLKLLERWPSG